MSNKFLKTLEATCRTFRTEIPSTSHTIINIEHHFTRSLVHLPRSGARVRRVPERGGVRVPRRLGEHRHGIHQALLMQVPCHRQRLHPHAQDALRTLGFQVLLGTEGTAGNRFLFEEPFTLRGLAPLEWRVLLPCFQADVLVEQEGSCARRML